MKTLIAIAALLLSPVVSSAWEFQKNPDRFPSLGLTYTGTEEDGDYNALQSFQDVEGKRKSLILDTRLPLSNSFTLSLGFGKASTHVIGLESPYYNANDLNTSGTTMVISGRYYFSR
jgi:hypothetical protein